MHDLLKELGFEQDKRQTIYSYKKEYGGFILNVFKNNNSEFFIASISISIIEICLPNIIDEKWLKEFDELNNNVSYL